MSKLLIIKWMQLLVHLWRNRETNGKLQLDNLTRIGSMVTHFQLSPYEFHWATRQGRDIAISANSLGTWFSQGEVARQNATSLRNYPEQNRVQRGCLPTYDLYCDGHWAGRTTCHDVVTYYTACPDKELLSCKLLAIPASTAAAGTLYTKHRHDRNHTRKAGAGTPCSLTAPCMVLPAYHSVFTGWVPWSMNCRI